MIRIQFLRLVAVLFSIGWLVAVAQAGERRRWIHDKGSFENADGKRWVEMITLNGKPFEFGFEEVNRNRDYIEIWDEHRDCYVRLYDGEVYVKNIKDGYREFQLFYRGKWEDMQDIVGTWRAVVPSPDPDRFKETYYYTVFMRNGTGYQYERFWNNQELRSPADGPAQPGWENTPPNFFNWRIADGDYYLIDRGEVRTPDPYGKMVVKRLLEKVYLVDGGGRIRIPENTNVQEFGRVRAQ
jgi:hypothetical protein